METLYLREINFFVIIDLLKVETIGDAYCVAGGLHKRSNYHAMQIAWMALKMMEYAGQQKSHDGRVIQVRVP